MTSVADTAPKTVVDWRHVVSSGVKLGIVTSIGVAIFAFASRGLAGTSEIVVQSVLILLGGVVFSFGPATFLRPVDVDTISWTAMIGLLGSLAYTVVDVVVFRPINLYHWTWDAIGGGSSYWYIPVWWMGSAFVAWLGSWAVANQGAAIAPVAIRTLAIGIVLAAILIGVGLVPFHAASVALAFTLALIVGVPVSAMMRKG